jgi:hypothetical protein
VRPVDRGIDGRARVDDRHAAVRCDRGVYARARVDPRVAAAGRPGAPSEERDPRDARDDERVHAGRVADRRRYSNGPQNAGIASIEPLASE